MIRVLSIVEATTVTGPVKNLLEFVRQAQLLQDPRVELVFATYRSSSAANQNDAFLEAVQAAGTTAHVITERFRFDPGVLPQMARIARDLQAHIIQTHSVKSHCLLRLSGLWKQYPWVAFHHGYTRPNRKMELYNQLDRWSLRKAPTVLTVTKAFEKELLEAGVPQNRITILHNAIASDWGARVTAGDVTRLRSTLAPQGEKLALAVGRLSQEKAHIDLLEALRQLSAARPDLKWRLALVGEGPERPRLAAAAEQLGGRVTLVGQVNDVSPYYAAADLFVLPSHSEGSPNVLLEAMAARIPVVATNVGGVPEMVTADEHALLVPPRHPDALAKAVEQILESPSLAAGLAERAAARVARVYSPAGRTLTLSRLYEEIVRPSRTTPQYCK